MIIRKYLDYDLCIVGRGRRANGDIYIPPSSIIYSIYLFYSGTKKRKEEKKAVDMISLSLKKEKGAGRGPTHGGMYQSARRGHGTH
jgi:hypothetical protein